MRGQRTGAGSYTLWVSLAVIAWAVATVVVCESMAGPGRLGIEELNVIVSTLGAGVGLVFYGLSARRLKDLDLSPMWTKVLAIPFLAVMVLPYLCFVSGQRVENRYGPAPEASGFFKVAGAVMALFIAIHFGFGAVTTFHKTRHAMSDASVTAP